MMLGRFATTPDSIYKMPKSLAFIREICDDEGSPHCGKCREWNDGREFRIDLTHKFVTPVGGIEFACPKNKPWVGKPDAVVTNEDGPQAIPHQWPAEIAAMLKYAKDGDRGIGDVIERAIREGTLMEKLSMARAYQSEFGTIKTMASAYRHFTGKIDCGGCSDKQERLNLMYPL